MVEKLTPKVFHAHPPEPVDDVGLPHELVEPILNGGVVGPEVLRPLVSGQRKDLLQTETPPSYID